MLKQYKFKWVLFHIIFPLIFYGSNNCNHYHSWQLIILDNMSIPPYIFSNIYIIDLSKTCMMLFSCVWFFATLWTVACQASLSMGFSKQEYWSGLPCPPAGDLPDPEIEPASPATSTSQADSLPLRPQGNPSQKYSCPNPWNLWTLHSNRDFANVIKLRIFRWGDYPWLYQMIWIYQINHKGP